MTTKIENTDTMHLVLPVAPANAGEMSHEELEKVAAGSVQYDGWSDNPVNPLELIR